MPEPSDGKLDRLRESLYSRSGQRLVLKKKTTPIEHDASIKTGWKESEKLPGVDDGELASSLMPRKKHAWASWFLGIAAIFFVIAVSTAAYIFVKGTNFISADNVNITVFGPATIHGGDEVTLGIEVVNNNATTLENVDLFVDFPIGAVQVDRPDQELTHFNELLGKLGPGERKRKDITFIMLGQEGEVKNFEIRAEYRPSGSNSIFPKKKNYSLNLQSAPISVVIKAPTEINANQQFDFSVVVTSNETKVLKNMAMTLSYPQGYAFKSATPDAAVDDNVWKIGDLAPGTSKTIKVNGSIDAHVNEERVITVNVGLLNDKTRNTISVPFALIKHPMVVRRPFMNITINALGDDESPFVTAYKGQQVPVKITWENTVPTTIVDAVIQVKLQGTAYSKGSVELDDGYYNSGSNTITFDGRSIPALRAVSPGETGSVDFTITPTLTVTPNGSYGRNPEVAMDVSVSGKRVGENRVTEDLVAVVKKSIRISPELNILASVSRANSPFTQKGSVPPQAGKETTYTVTYKLTNTTSMQRNVQLKVQLPTSVKWLSQVSPSAERVEYNSVSGEVVWNVGDVLPNAGYGIAAKELSFQVSLTPGQNQVGTMANITGETVVVATDEFTTKVQSTSHDPLTTRFDGARNGEEVVKP